MFAKIVFLHKQVSIYNGNKAKTQPTTEEV